MNALNAAVIQASLGQVGTTILIILGAVVVIELLVWLVAKRLFHSRHHLVLMLVMPAVVGLGLLVIYPIVYEFGLAFSNMSLRSFRNPRFGLAEGFQNFARVFTKPVLKQQYFVPILARTVLWTVIQVSVHVSVGLLLALMLNRPLRLKAVYKALLILPWAVPDVISGLAWRGEFHFQYGVFNILLNAVGLDPVQWKINAFWNFVAMNITNIWLGIPFMMVICLGGLQSISKEYYEAADMDGASGSRKLFGVTIPLMRPILTPAIVLGIIWTFNNFNVPYFINENELETSDILVTALFRSAFEYNQYGFAAAFALVIFLILFGISSVYIKVSGGLKGVRE